MSTTTWMNRTINFDVRSRNSVRNISGYLSRGFIRNTDVCVAPVLVNFGVTSAFGCPLLMEEFPLLTISYRFISWARNGPWRLFIRRQLTSVRNAGVLYMCRWHRYRYFNNIYIYGRWLMTHVATQSRESCLEFSHCVICMLRFVLRALESVK